VVTGSSEGISQAAYVSLALPDFGLTLSPTTLYLNQRSRVAATATASPENGFTGKVDLSLTSGLPSGVFSAILSGKDSDTARLVLAADRDALTGVNNAVAVSAQSGDITQNFSSAILAVSAATGEWGKGTPIDLSSAYNVYAAFSDGTNFSTQGGLGGFAFSSNLLTPSRILNGVQFHFGKPNAVNGVAGTGQVIALPAGHYKTLQLLASGINGNQSGQTLTVTYADGTTSQFTQSFSDWFSPSSNLGEAEAVAMPHRNIENGTEDDRQFNLYGYAFLLDEAKEVKSLTLPNDSNVIVLAGTLVSPDLGTPADLASAFNATGIYTDGTTFSGSGGADTGGAAYSGNLLGDQTGSRSVVVNGAQYDIAAANHPNIVYGTGTPISLPEGLYDQVRILGTGVQGAQTGQQIVIHYKDGSSETFSQSFSDWFSPQQFPNESEVFAMPYRDYFDGSQDNRTFNLYQYILPLNGRKEVSSIELPNNRFVLALAITLTRHEER
jgi:hypothetical protein